MPRRAPSAARPTNYDSASLLITSNLAFADRPQVFGDAKMTTAMPKVLHQPDISVRCLSYRLFEHRFCKRDVGGARQNFLEPAFDIAGGDAKRVGGGRSPRRLVSLANGVNDRQQKLGRMSR